MCGIAGFIGTGDMSDLRRMTSCLSHRGPDDEGFWQQEDIFLGHRRLSILDLAGGHQPMLSHDERFVTVFNGEIYTYIELQAELLSLGATFHTDHSDTEIFTEAYREWGPDFHSRLNGMWAAAIYDTHERTLFLTRDRFGKKPLYYRQSRNSFVFASELTALAQHSEVECSTSSSAIQKYLAYGYIPAPATAYQGISKLPAGSWLKVDVESLRLQHGTYWRFELAPRPAENPDEVAATLLEQIRAATEIRLRADVPVGVFLSGGIDSTTVATLAAQSVPRLTTFSIGFEDKSFDETPFIREAARHLNVDHEHRTISAAVCRQLIPEVLGRLDEPLGDPSLIPTYMVCKVARERVKVCLSGDGADELFAGYDPFRAVRAASIYGAIVPRWLHSTFRGAASLLPVSFDNISLDFKLKRTLRGLSYPAEYRNAAWMAPCDLPEIERLTGSVRRDEVFSEAADSWRRGSGLGAVDRTLLYFTDLYLREDILTKVDRASMLNGLEVRSPFLDPRVVDLARTLPHDFKLRGTTTKWILKQAVRNVIPPGLAGRKKKGFGMPVGKWFHDGSLGLQIESLSSVVDTGEVKRMLAKHRRREANYSWALWSLHVLGSWCEAQRELMARGRSLQHSEALSSR